MIPIYEQGSGKGVGLMPEQFIDVLEGKFEHGLKLDKDTQFAFIFRDFQDQKLNGILKDQGVFAQLDRLSGEDFHVFYLHLGFKKSFDAISDGLAHVLGLDGRLIAPCIVFFKLIV